jgi:G3E family GTPase
MTMQLFASRTTGPFGRRQRRARGARVPVTIVTGFLGAGKTTLVRRFLETPEGHGTAVVVNEFGAVGIDDALLRSSAEETVLLGNGCLCCSTRSDLQAALARLLAERTRGTIPDFRRVVIETSGLADPAPILQTFASDRALGAEFAIEAVIAVVDAATGMGNLTRAPEARRQVVLADRLVLSKTDIAADAVAPLRDRLATLNPRAPIVVATNGGLDPRWLVEAAHDEAHKRSPFLAEAEHGDDIRSFVITEALPLNWAPFARGMEALISLRGADLLRAKGFLHVAGCTGPVVVHFVQHLAHPPVELAEWPTPERGSRLVFITRGIGEREVRDLFAALKALAAGDGAESTPP